MVFASLLRVNSLSFVLCVPIIRPFRLNLSRIRCSIFRFVSEEEEEGMRSRRGSNVHQFLSLCNDFRVLGYNSVFHVPLVIELCFSLSISVEERAIVIKLSNETFFHPRYSLYHGNSPFSELVLHYIPFYRPFLKIIKKIRRTIIKQKFCIPILPLKIGQKSASPP